MDTWALFTRSLVDVSDPDQDLRSKAVSCKVTGPQAAGLRSAGSHQNTFPPQTKMWKIMPQMWAQVRGGGGLQTSG